VYVPGWIRGHTLVCESLCLASPSKCTSAFNSFSRRRARRQRKHSVGAAGRPSGCKGYIWRDKRILAVRLCELRAWHLVSHPITRQACSHKHTPFTHFWLSLFISLSPSFRRHGLWVRSHLYRRRRRRSDCPRHCCVSVLISQRPRRPSGP